MQFTSFEFVTLTQDFELLPFKCRDNDLNHFFFDDAKHYLSELMAVTYMFIDPAAHKTVAYYGNRTGCRFITVDAYTEATNFYIKNGFDFFTQKDRNDDTRLMYFDLLPFKKAQTTNSKSTN